ncbi:Transposon Ty3-I Gag-Pol polyprotein [Araneus ventricosus]|uniref:RNA-directed DNA polymerase n=1 Tax=Araneus ventricosus TaxID=182803 RepID=A0A4Y2BP96_ARAVE|nr:Transposon Ty3-I Gag-Pol polyprotein [Araneus ventricosus]
MTSGCDASQVAIGAVLKQPDSSGNLHPVSYHSRTLRSYEKNYCITELECLAIVDALDKFYYYLHGKKFIIHTDHAALVWLKNVKNLRGRLFRWSLKLSMFDYEVKYLKGTANVEADMLSRHPTAQYIQHSVHLLELDEIKTHQNLDNLDNSKYKKINDVLVLKKKNLFKIVVPFSLRRKVLQNAHEQFGHSSTQKMINLITPQYYWPHINQDISVFVKHCDVCQLNKKKRQKRFGLLQTVPPTDRPIDTVVGFNYYNSTKKYLHLVIDHATRYVWAFPSKSETTETYANCLKQVFQIQVPTKLLSDRNSAFTSSKFKRFLRNYNVKHLLTSSHHPQTNGKCERVNQSIVTKLKCKVNSSPTKTPWTKLLEQ